MILQNAIEYKGKIYKSTHVHDYVDIPGLGSIDGGHEYLHWSIKKGEKYTNLVLSCTDNIQHIKSNLLWGTYHMQEEKYIKESKPLSKREGLLRKKIYNINTLILEKRTEKRIIMADKYSKEVRELRKKISVIKDKYFKWERLVDLETAHLHNIYNIPNLSALHMFIIELIIWERGR